MQTTYEHHSRSGRTRVCVCEFAYLDMHFNGVELRLYHDLGLERSILGINNYR